MTSHFYLGLAAQAAAALAASPQGASPAHPSVASLPTARGSSAETGRGFDGIELPSQVSAEFRFECRNASTSLRYTHHESSPGDVALEQARTVELDVLTVSGRSIAPADYRRIEALFQSFAWVERVSATCYNGTVYLLVRAMPAAAYFASFRENARRRPPIGLRSVIIGPAGEVTIS